MALAFPLSRKQQKEREQQPQAQRRFSINRLTSINQQNPVYQRNSGKHLLKACFLSFVGTLFISTFIFSAQADAYHHPETLYKESTKLHIHTYRPYTWRHTRPKVDVITHSHNTYRPYAQPVTPYSYSYAYPFPEYGQRSRRNLTYRYNQNDQPASNALIGSLIGSLVGSLAGDLVHTNLTRRNVRYYAPPPIYRSNSGAPLSFYFSHHIFPSHQAFYQRRYRNHVKQNRNRNPYYRNYYPSRPGIQYRKRNNRTTGNQHIHCVWKKQKVYMKNRRLLERPVKICRKIKHGRN